MDGENKDKRFTLRINKDLFEIVKKEASKNKRAIGREIEYTLEKVYLLDK
jgi:hypothetical protein